MQGLMDEEEREEEPEIRLDVAETNPNEKKVESIIIENMTPENKNEPEANKE